MKDDRRLFVTGPYYENPAEKQDFLRGIFDRTAPHYERIAKWGWFGTGEVYRRQALLRAGAEPEMTAIDVASGTGAVARALLTILDSPDQLVCVEPSAGMIAESEKTVPAVHHQATAEEIPVDSGTFDLLTMGFALRHVDNLDTAFAEFHRVLKPGGKILIMDVTRPESLIGQFWFRLYFKHFLPFLSLISTGDRESHRLMKYYWDTMDQMISREAVVGIFRDAGFHNVEHHVVAGCFSEYRAER